MPPIYNKVNPADAPILTLALTSDSIPLSKVEDYTDTRLAEKISQLPGVGAVTISGGQKPAVRVQVNPTQLASYGLNLENVRAAPRGGEPRCGQGQLRRPQPELPDRRQRPDHDERPTTASSSSPTGTASPVMLKSVANVVDGIENNQASAWMNKVPAVIVNIQRQPGANIIDGRRPDQGAAAEAAGDDPPDDQDHRPDRPDDDRPRLRRRRRVRAVPLHRPRGRRHLRLPAHVRRRRSSRASRCPSR